MKLELPDNNASVLFHMGNALQSIARDIDASLPVNGHKTTHTETVGEVSHSVTVEPLVKLSDVERYGQAWKEHYGSIKDDENLIEPINDNTTVEVSDTIDADGLPWDQRIHSRGKTRLADNTWRMARKPNDKTDEEWAEYVEGVKTELRALMAIPVAVTCDPNEADPFAIEPPIVDAMVTPPVVDAVVTPPVDSAVIAPPVIDAVVTPPVVDAVVTPPVVDAVVTPPVVDAVVTPPVVDAVVTPPVVDAVVTPPPADFGALMRFITANKAKLTSPLVDDVLAGQGLASLALLATRPELIPQFHTALVKLL